MTADLKEQIARAICVADEDDASNYDDMASAALSAIEADGYVVVPREPTEAMELAAQSVDGDWEHASGPDHWRAMLESATKG